MKTVISASRRTDLAAFFPEWLAGALRNRKARVVGPAGVFEADLSPDSVHTLVLWSKDFSKVLNNAFGLRELLSDYRQLYLHFTITGLGGGVLEPAAPAPSAALAQVEPLIRLAGDPRRVSLRFDPVVFWREGGRVRSNLSFFPVLAETAARFGVRDIRISFAQWYAKARRRAAQRGLGFVDPDEKVKKELAAGLAAKAHCHGLALHACSQSFLTSVDGILPSACIDGRLLSRLHPEGEAASDLKDRSQRQDCRCTRSVDIGSYAQPCPHGCVYCYANARTG